MDVPQHDLRWVGDGSNGFPKALPEDVVEYIVFLVDSKLSDAQARERLQAFQRALATVEKKFLRDYIWQRDAIKLDLTRSRDRWMLKGSSNYGDSVADEWLIVYLLRELSSEFADVWIRVYDTDGEFLLIEAAHALPGWLNPEVAENRVWINNHRLLVIPLAQDANPQPLTQAEALQIIDHTPARPQHYPTIQKEAFHRLNEFPAAIAANQHHATLPLPRKVVHMLHINPSYVAPVVEAFYLRDPISLRLLQPDKSNTSLHFPPEDFVHVSVRFTKVLYAQLLGQNWSPPGVWGEILEQLVEKTKAPEKAEVAIKLAAGMEMLTQHKLFADKKAVREIKLLLEDLASHDDTLPTDAELAAWPKREDDEGWLDIDFTEFEKELAGKGGQTGQGFGDKAAQQNLKKMVERFNKFLEDEDAGIDGAGGLDPMDVDDDSDTQQRDWDDPEDSGDEAQTDEDDEDDEYADAEFAEYEKALEEFMALSAAEKAVLTDEARELARTTEAEKEEDEEIKKLSDMMEAELFGHGAHKVTPDQQTSDAKASKTSLTQNKAKGKAKAEKLPEATDGSTDSDDDEHLLDEDYNLADNMLKSFKGQVGMAGPAGNLMALMGVQFPPDADDAQNKGKGTVVER